MPASAQPIRLDPDTPAKLVVLIDIEEEFDWEADFDRSSTGQSALCCSSTGSAAGRSASGRAGPAFGATANPWA